MLPRYELFDHTADLGIRLHAPSLEALIPLAAEALYAVIGELVPECGAASAPVLLQFSGDSPDTLLRDYLARLLLDFETRHQIFCEVTVSEFSDRVLRAEGRFCPIDSTRSIYHREVKAITYHDLAVRKTEGGYEATIIVDI